LDDLALGKRSGRSSNSVLRTTVLVVRATPLGALLAFGAPLAWSLGSHASRRLEQPTPGVGAAVQWLVGGLELDRRQR
jgi:drug/metabolite transporter (DMT)-like permease